MSLTSLLLGIRKVLKGSLIMGKDIDRMTSSSLVTPTEIPAVHPLYLAFRHISKVAVMNRQKKENHITSNIVSL